MENRCVICGEIIPEGRQICPNCEKGYDPKPDEEEKDDCNFKSDHSRVVE